MLSVVFVAGVLVGCSVGVSFAVLVAAAGCDGPARYSVLDLKRKQTKRWGKCGSWWKLPYHIQPTTSHRRFPEWDSPVLSSVRSSPSIGPPSGGSKV